MLNLPGCTSLSSIPTLASAEIGVGMLWFVGLLPFPAIVVVLPPMDSLCAPQAIAWPMCEVGTALWGLSRPAGVCNGELPGVDVCEWDAWVWHPPVLGDRRAWCLVLQIINDLGINTHAQLLTECFRRVDALVLLAEYARIGYSPNFLPHNATRVRKRSVM